MATVANSGVETKTTLLDEGFRKKFADIAHQGANVSTLFNSQRGLKDPMLELIHQVVGSTVAVEKVFEVEKQKDPVGPLLWCILKMLGQTCRQLNTTTGKDQELLDGLEQKLGVLKQLAI